MKASVCESGQKLEIFIPFLGKCRPPLRRCCQTCTPRSWDGFYHRQLSSLGFRDTIRVTEEDTRYRGWLVRRVCGFLAVWDWKVLADTPGDLLERVCHSQRVQDVAAGRSRGSRGDGASLQQWKEKILKILVEIQAPLSPIMLRLCNWALLKLLNCLFLSVQLHRGQLEMVLRAARMPGVPLVFLSTHKSQLDGLLLSFLLFSQGLGVPRVTVGGRVCSPRLRALLSRLGGIFLPSRMEQMPIDRDEELPGAVLAAYVEEVLRSRQPLLIFLEEPPVAMCLSAAARQWLALVYRAVRDGTVPDILLVPVGIAYDVVPGGSHWEGARGTRPLGLGALLRAACRALRRPLGCARVDFAQPFSLREFVAQNLAGQSSVGKPPEEPLVPTILGMCPSRPDEKAAEVWQPGPATASGWEAEEEMLVTRLGLHCLSDGVACSAVMAVGITSALLLHKHREGVFLSRLMRDFAWLLEETLLHQRDTGFSGQLRHLVQHSLSLLGPRLHLYRLSPIGDVLVVPKASAEALGELGLYSAAILPVFASEAVGACAIRAVLMEMLPFLGAAMGSAGVVLSEDELLHKIQELLRLLPPNLLGLQPCQPLDGWSQDIVDKLLLCGLLEAEEPEGGRWVCDSGPRPLSQGQSWAALDFTDSDSDSNGDSVVPNRCFKLSQPQGSPSFLLFLCRLLSPPLRTLAAAVAFLDRPSWPQPEAAYVEALLQFLAEEKGFEHLDRSLALSSLQTFKEMGVLEAVRSPPGPLLHLAQPFRSSTSRAKLGAFIQQFIQP
ncbi:glycerol-3-phosphate acyltransferase 2, mitochondrial [Falco peregrinus]|uniref:glycerol-3-phosphate acyltransferase 2, mitochondrial n=1 Tax=Falco peregrinus TaxID=8954 RepID=UPI0024796B41|nr:glycerol-3-phosphate acyltransferase 2, mitochondrial [Falco peregrinus]XP_055676335.1 glycerol-3-phosphate acyltransferase 2, mitochondrial [Falco peregrinus]XP_055676336.1 glycerol-3-phosphate acyltransferase 2, mitochondrial [Falco peregrinus]XP_055676337.1 glycerol-3-phosphate acyltransferase 2, mitochondrial [Falco peregrinus]